MEFDLQKNIFGLLMLLSGTHLIIGAFLLVGASGLLVLFGLGIGIVLMITSLFFMAGLTSGGALVFVGIQIILADMIKFYLYPQIGLGETTSRVLLIIGVLSLIIGMITIVIGYRDAIERQRISKSLSRNIENRDK